MAGATPVASKSIAFGEGLSSAAAGVPASFEIELRDEMGRMVFVTVPPKLVAVIKPAPLQNSLIAQENGRFLCTYECEFGAVEVEIGIMLDDENIIGSPFKFRSST